MSEELLQRDLKKNPEKIGSWDYYNIGSTTINQLKEAGIIRSVDYGEVGRKKVDGIIVKQKEVIAIVEYKQSSSFNTVNKKKSAILQELEVARKLKAKLIIATDGHESLWVNVETGNSVIDRNDCKVNYKFDVKDDKLQSFIKEVLNSINNNNDKILPEEVVDPTDLAKQIWQDIWSVSGATPENSLYSFIELFIFKYLSDLGILKGAYSFDSLFSEYNNHDASEVLDLYAVNIRPKIKLLFPENPIDKTTVINGAVFVDKDQNSVSRYGLVFKKILERFYKYGRLSNIDHDFKSKLFESFLKESISKKNWGQFFTPIKVVKAVNKMASSELREGIKICDPACGVGKFPLEFIKERIGEFFSVENGKIKQRVQIIGFDKGFDEGEQKTIILAKANMLIYFCDLIKENKGMTSEFSELFNNTFTLQTKSVLGTLSETTKDEYDLILTNPPYVTSGVSNLKNEISADLNLKEYYKISATGVEGLFMEWIVRALKPNGKAFIIIPDGILERSSDKNLRKFILDNCYIDAIISLPVSTFFTTQKKTSILAITKKFNNHKQDFPVFTYLVSEIGESRDVNRFDIDQDDLTEAVELFNSFKGNKRRFHEFQGENPDLRCKLWGIEKFDSEGNWLIDKWWKKEELINLGILDKQNVVDINSFSIIINDISNKLKDFALSLNKVNKGSNNEFGFKEIPLVDLFEIKKGSAKYTKEYINKNSGEYPVYSSQTTNDGVIGKINNYDYDCKCLTWTTDGYAGIVFLRNGKFNLSTHCGALIPKYESTNIFLEYLHIWLLENLKDYAVGSQNKRVTVEIIKNVNVSIPVDENGNFDLIKQKEIVEIHKYINDLKENIKEDKKKIDNLIISIEETECDINKKTVSVDNIFDLSFSRTNNSSFTKSFIERNKGSIPVYSASKDENSIDYGYVQDNLDNIKYFENCLTFNIDGSIGKIFLRNGRFSLSEKVIPLIVRERYKDFLDLNYLRFILEIEVEKERFSYSNKAGKDKIKNIEISIPVDENGNFDLIKQKEISEKNKIVSEIRKKIKLDLEKIEKIKIH